MATNLVSYIMQLLTPDVIGRLSGALGLDAGKTQRAIAAAVPALLAALGGVAAQPGGAQKVADAAKQQSGVLGNLAGMLSSGGGETSLAQVGSQILPSLFGAGGGGALANAVSSYAGLDKGAGSSLLGMLAPIVMGGVAQQSGGDLSANNIANLFASQKDNIAAALPAGVKDMLGSTGLLNALGGTMRTATAAANQATGQAAAAAASASDAGQRVASRAASTSYRWLYWLIAALVILAALYLMFNRRTPEVATQPPPPAPAESTAPAQTAPATPSLTVGGVDVGKQITDTLTGLQTAASGITDVASAQAALPKFQSAQGDIDKLSAMVGQLSAEQKTALAGIVTPMMSTLNGVFDKILAIPGVSDVLKPTIDTLKTKLAALSA